MTIVLVGALGAGKTTVGAELADLLGKSFVDVHASMVCSMIIISA